VGVLCVGDVSEGFSIGCGTQFVVVGLVERGPELVRV
jgi:hypothetical protein